MNRDEEPIAALASGQSAAAIAIIRISGVGCLNLVKECLSIESFKSPRKVILTSLKDPTTQQIIDEPLVVYFKGPHSYTGQDLVEIYVHGGPFIIKKSLSILYQLGCRPAEPGEFTRRAFLNGKMDLTTAEGIRELANASSESQWLAARQLAIGTLRKEIENLRFKLLHAMAWLEARIDFPEEKETSTIEQNEVIEKVSNVYHALKNLISSYSSGKIAKEGLSVALVGPPNAGKSTLLNELLGEERAIVTEIAGTTRDYLEESCFIAGRRFKLIDTAGIRNSENKVERIGIQRSLEIAKQADCVILLMPSDGNQQQFIEGENWLLKLSVKHVIKLITKSDLNFINRHQERLNNGWQVISCHNGEGIQALKKTLCQLIDQYILPLTEQMFISSERHLHALKKAVGFIENFNEGVTVNAYEEMLAFELRQAASALSEVIGQVESDDILDVIFTSFCIGK